ncbi:hypothetical protein FRB96_002634 [Tulasnella sp. 330]|nr:hypothetical protein FRB96_002634 [Tulasnella sp. 330]KAG8882884.1 hypothetical protein FRB97_007603 [Tulasnella sp. 331]KAG8884825.1 hypothetical protein FRB98_002151 [Tulasnella sp. 332]
MTTLNNDGLNSVKGAPEEHMMGTHIRGLADTCFEEGHYESGLDVLNKSRSLSTYPAPYHVRVMLYLALYPSPVPIPTLASGLATKGCLPPSPRKERYKKNLTPTPAASAQALNLLRAFTEASSSPANLFRGLPARGKTYIESRGGWQIDSSSALLTATSISAAQSMVSFIPDIGVTGEENKIVRAAMLFTTAKDIWSFLEEGFIKRLDAGTAVDPEDDIMGLKLLGNEVKPAAKKGKSNTTTEPKKREPQYEDEEEEDACGSAIGDGDTFLIEDSQSHREVVAECAWPVLDWLLTVFERDEEVTALSGSGRRSPVLLSQIPVSFRTDLLAPLKIAFTALGSTTASQERFALGMRLIRLIINLTAPTPARSISPTGCLRQINASLISILDKHPSPLPLGFLGSFFAGLPSTNPSFKLRLACMYLASRSLNGGASIFLGEQGVGTSQSTSTGRTRRSRPAPRRAQLKDPSDPEDISNPDTDTSSTPNGLNKDLKWSAEPFPLPIVGDVLKLLSVPIDLALNQNGEEDEDFTSTHSAPRDPSEAGAGQHSLQLRIRLDHATATVQLLAAASRLIQPHKVKGDVQEKWMEALSDQSLRKAFEQALEALEDDQTMDVDRGESIPNNDAVIRKKLTLLREGAMTMLEAWEQRASA